MNEIEVEKKLRELEKRVKLLETEKNKPMPIELARLISKNLPRK